jgi:hypothetical protein
MLIHDLILTHPWSMDASAFRQASGVACWNASKVRYRTDISATDSYSLFKYLKGTLFVTSSFLLAFTRT